VAIGVAGLVVGFLELLDVTQLIGDCYIARHDKKMVGFATHFIAYYSWTGKANLFRRFVFLAGVSRQCIGGMLFEK
jgi:hypothetical protein